jgi:hypothetical protein
MLLLIFVILPLFFSSKTCNLFLPVTTHISVDVNLLSLLVFVTNFSLLRDTGLATGTQIRVHV